MTKRIMRAFKMNEISAVDRPAQAHARMAIMKRAVNKGMYDVAEFARVIASVGYLISNAESEANIEGDNSPVPQKLRSWLASGARVFQDMAQEEIDELVNAVARKQASDVDAYLARNYRSEIEKRTFTAEQREAAANSGAALPDGSFPIENASDLRNAMRAIGRAKVPAKAKAHIRARAKALGLTSELSDAFKGMFAKAAAALGDSIRSIIGDPAADKSTLLDKSLSEFTDHVAGLADDVDKALAAGSAADKSEESDMDIAVLKKALGLADTATEAEITAELTKHAGLKTTVGKLETDLAIAKAAMTDEEKAFHDGLKDEDAKKEFRGKSKEERTAAMKKRDDLPPAIKKALEEADDLKKRVTAMEDKEALAVFTKHASAAGLAETESATLQKAYKGDKEALDKLVGFVKTANSQRDAAQKLAGVFKELGSSQGGTGLTALDELSAKAEELRKKETGLTKDQAFAKVYSDPANVELAKRERAENRPVPA